MHFLINMTKKCISTEKNAEYPCVFLYFLILYKHQITMGEKLEVVQPYLGQSFLLGPCQDGLVDEAFQHLGQYGYNVYSHI